MNREAKEFGPVMENPIPWKCELCSKLHKKCMGVTNEKKLSRTQEKLGFRVELLCPACYEKIKATKGIRNHYKVPKLRWDVKRAMQFSSLSDMESLAEYAERLKRSLEKEAADAMEVLKDATIRLNDVVISETTLKAAYSEKLWESYPERRLRADRAISDFQLRIMIFGRDGNKCRRCNSRENLSIDHIKPVALGGDESLDNLQTLCKSCNSAKGAKTDFK